jgi:putative transcriptional regulator
VIQHHPGEDLLLGLAAGRLPEGQALVVAVHLESCGECRARLHTLQAVGGAVLDEAAPVQPAADAWTRTLARIDAPAPAPRVAFMPKLPAAWPTGVQWPKSLAGCEVSGWKWMGPGMRFARVTLPQATAGSLFLLRIPPGCSIPSHTHRGTELTQVLCGSFNDGHATYAAGDFEDADAQVHHQPVVREGVECICLAYVDAPLRFDSRIAGLLGGWAGL